MNTIRNLAILGLLIFGNSSKAGVIDFELDANGLTPEDNQVVDFNEVFDVNGVLVSFGFDTDDDGVVDASAVFEQSENNDSNDDTGFWGIGGVKDVAAAGYEETLGDFFLRQSEPYKPFGIFTISYQSPDPVTEASGEIWDIDGKPNKSEQFLVEAFNDNELLASLLSPLGIDKTLNAKPWRFSFEDLSDITRIEISFVGTKTRGIGLAFDNFNPTSTALPTDVPEPDLLIIFALAVLFLIVKRRRTVNKN